MEIARRRRVWDRSIERKLYAGCFGEGHVIEMLFTAAFSASLYSSFGL